MYSSQKVCGKCFENLLQYLDIYRIYIKNIGYFWYFWFFRYFRKYRDIFHPCQQHKHQNHDNTISKSRRATREAKAHRAGHPLQKHQYQITIISWAGTVQLKTQVLITQKNRRKYTKNTQKTKKINKLALGKKNTLKQNLALAVPSS